MWYIRNNIALVGIKNRKTAVSDAFEKMGQMRLSESGFYKNIEKNGEK